MAADRSQAIPAAITAALAGQADISLRGDIDKGVLDSFLLDLEKAREQDGDVVLEITTQGGDAELARRIVLEIERAHDRLKGNFLFLGKAVVYSAGVSIMAAFAPDQRYLTRDTMLLVHGRQLDTKLEIAGPVRSSIPQVEALLAQLQVGIDLEEIGFRRLIEGSKVSLDEVIRKATHNWYVTAQEALDLGLVRALV